LVHSIHSTDSSYFQYASTLALTFLLHALPPLSVSVAETPNPRIQGTTGRTVSLAKQSSEGRKEPRQMGKRTLPMGGRDGS
jgi:hypothetical protein